MLFESCSRSPFKISRFRGFLIFYGFAQRIRLAISSTFHGWEMWKLSTAVSAWTWDPLDREIFHRQFATFTRTFESRQAYEKETGHAQDQCLDYMLLKQYGVNPCLTRRYGCRPHMPQKKGSSAVTLELHIDTSRTTKVLTIVTTRMSPFERKCQRARASGSTLGGPCTVTELVCCSNLEV